MAGQRAHRNEARTLELIPSKRVRRAQPESLPAQAASATAPGSESPSPLATRPDEGSCREHVISQLMGEMRGALTAAMLAGECGFESGTSVTLADAALQEAAPRDPFERMLIEQSLWCHERVRRLSLSAVRLENVANANAVHAQCDATMNTFRRGMMALRQYRAMATPSPLVAIQQVNESAAGKVVVNAGTRHEGKA